MNERLQIASKGLKENLSGLYNIVHLILKCKEFFSPDVKIPAKSSVTLHLQVILHFRVIFFNIGHSEITIFDIANNFLVDKSLNWVRFPGPKVGKHICQFKVAEKGNCQSAFYPLGRRGCGGNKFACNTTSFPDRS